MRLVEMINDDGTVVKVPESAVDNLERNGWKALELLHTAINEDNPETKTEDF